MSARSANLICHRCGRELVPGEGNFYVVKIVTYAESTAPSLSDADAMSQHEIARQIEQIIREMDSMTRQDLMDQVYRRMTIHLCGQCYRTWIENPT